MADATTLSGVQFFPAGTDVYSGPALSDPNPLCTISSYELYKNGVLYTDTSCVSIDSTSGKISYSGNFCSETGLSIKITGGPLYNITSITRDEGPFDVNVGKTCVDFLTTDLVVPTLSSNYD